jgi:hypothetical protein
MKVPWQVSVSILAVEATDASGIHFRLQEGAVNIDLLKKLTVGVIEVRAQQ